MTTRDEILRRDFSESFFGIRVIGSELITKTVQARTHKNKRINKKWLKRYGYREAPDLTAVYVCKLQFGTCIIAHPKAVEKVKKELKKHVNT